MIPALVHSTALFEAAIFPTRGKLSLAHVCSFFTCCYSVTKTRSAPGPAAGGR